MKKVFYYFACLYLSLLGLITLLVTFLYPMAVSQNIEMILSAPSREHIFGTDTLGRDLFLRVIIGGEISLSVGLFCAVLSLGLGVSYGAFSGWCGGLADRILMRICDLLISIPSFILVAVISLFSLKILNSNHDDKMALIALCLAISATHWMSLARVSRAMVVELKNKAFIEAAIALGGRRLHILRQHLLPNMRGTLLVLGVAQIPNTILFESFMSFIGLGIQPPLASWGTLMREGWKSLSGFPHLLLLPSLILFLTIWSLHIILDEKVINKQP